jgi:Kef-type K+ transport system membrane component KefB
MSSAELGSLLFLLLLFISTAHLLGLVFVRLRQPRVIGEILAGVLLGPALLGRFSQMANSSAINLPTLVGKNGPALDFIYQLGLLLLMFISGIETRHLFGREERRSVAWLVIVGTGLPFLTAILVAPWLPLASMAGAVQQRTPLILILGIGVAVTSIPVISRIFHDLKILQTRFARLVLGVAVIEDIGLWAVLAIATALAASAKLATGQMLAHVAAALIYFGIGLTLAPAVIHRITRARWNVMPAASPVAYVVLILFAYGAIAAVFNVSLVFAAFLAGFAVVNDGERFSQALDSIENFSFAIFIPIYFALVGYRLDLGHSFSFAMLGIYLPAACTVKLLSVWLGARLAGFRGLDNLNLAIATNARGGPGIVLASVAYDAHIINSAFFTTLVLAAVLTSQAAGAWLEYVLRRGWPLLSAAECETTPVIETPSPEMAA